MKYKITGGTVLLEKDGILSPSEQDIYVADGRITAAPAADAEFEKVDAKGMLILPGLVNAHTHAYMSFMRCHADDVSFDEWLFRRVMPIEDAMTGEDAYWSALLGCLEMISTGTTAVADMHMFKGFVPRAFKDAGMRAFIGRGLVGEDLETDGASRFEEAMEEMREYRSDKLRFLLAPHAIYTCGEKLLRQVNEKAKELGLKKEIHLAESDYEYDECMKKHGKSPVAYLASLGFLDKDTLLAHCVKVSDEDIRLLAESGASVVTNPISNAKLGNGSAPVAKMLAAGVNVCLGTDGAASNNAQNIFREMGYLSLMQKAAQGSPLTLSAQETLRLPTVNAARALGEKLGEIKEGCLADLVFLDKSALSLLPANDPVSALVYAANGSETDSVMIGGEFVYRKKEFTKIDRERVLFETARIAKKYL